MIQEYSNGSKAAAYARWIIRWRIPILIAGLAVMIAAASGSRFLQFSDDYRDFFSENNPELTAFEALQNIYTKNDNVLFVLAPKDGDVFTRSTLVVVEDLVGEAES